MMTNRFVFHAQKSKIFLETGRSSGPCQGSVKYGNNHEINDLITFPQSLPHNQISYLLIVLHSHYCDDDDHEPICFRVWLVHAQQCQKNLCTKVTLTGKTWSSTHYPQWNSRKLKLKYIQAMVMSNTLSSDLLMPDNNINNIFVQFL